MGTFTYEDLLSVNLGHLGSAVEDWAGVVRELGKQEKNAHDGLLSKSERAHWAGVNATVTREFVRKTAKEISDLHLEAKSIWSVLNDAHSELVTIQKQFKALVDEAKAHKDPPFAVVDGGKGTVKVMATVCTPDGKESTQPVLDLEKWYSDTLTGMLAHAMEVNSFAVTALKNSHGSDPMDAGHAVYTSLDEVMLPRITELAKLGKKASPAQLAEIRNLWQSLSPTARAQLWQQHKDELIEAGLLTPTVKQVAHDEGAGPWNVKDPGLGDYKTRLELELLANGADAMGMSDAARNMAHYLDNSGTTMNLPVDKMMNDVPGFRSFMDQQVKGKAQGWREEALRQYAQNGGRPVTIPVATGNTGYYFKKDENENWFYAVGGADTNVTGAVTVTPGADGRPKVSLDYQANVGDRYNWDVNQGKSVTIGGQTITDANQAKLHTVGLAREFDMRGSSSVKHMDITDGVGAPPAPDEPGWRGSRVDPGRESAGR